MDPLNTCCQPPYHNHHHYLTSSNRVLHSGQVSCLAPTRQDPGELSKLPALSKHRGTLEGICGCPAIPQNVCTLMIYNKEDKTHRINYPANAFFPKPRQLRCGTNFSGLTPYPLVSHDTVEF